MDVLIEPAPWSSRTWDPHLLVAAGLAAFTGYLLFVLVLSIIGPVATPTPSVVQDRPLSVRIETRVEPGRAEPATSEVTEAPPEFMPDERPVAAPRPAPESSDTVDRAARTETRGAIDLTLPEREPMRRMPPVCRAGPCAPGTVKPPTVRAARRPASEVLADLDPEVLKNLDLEALGIDPGLADVFGEREVRLSENCDLVQRADNVVTRQLTSPQFVRCRRSTASKTRAQALLDALREKRPDLFEDR